MKKQIKKKSEALITPLRLTADEAAALQLLQEYLKESTRNGTVVNAIKNYQYIHSMQEIIMQKNRILKNSFQRIIDLKKMISESESEIKNIIEQSKHI